LYNLSCDFEKINLINKKMDKRVEILNETYKDNLPSEFEGKIWDDKLLEAMTEFAKYYHAEQLKLCEVSRSIGKMTKQAFGTVTPKQKKIEGWMPCQFCKYNNDEIGKANNCHECVIELEGDQYYR